MDITYLIKVVTLILTISVATERLVELIKGFFASWTWLNTQNNNPVQERRRQLTLHLMSVLGGVVTAFLARPIVKSSLGIEEQYINYWAALLGFCASGGSSFWNSILTYLLKAKDIKATTADTIKSQALVDQGLQTIAAAGLRTPLMEASTNAALVPELRAKALRLMQQMPAQPPQ